jgi:hypothetical protein
VADSLFNGHRIQALTVIDNLSRGCLAITVDRNLRGDDVVDAMEHIKSMRGAPKRIQIDNVLHAESRFVRRHKDAFAATGPQICGALADTDGFTVLNTRYKSRRKTRTLSTRSLPLRPYREGSSAWLPNPV